jgi:hypothetical protein
VKKIAVILKDRKRSQRGSVLSGVLIITAFLAIIAGGLMTELSGSFLLSRALMHRVENEATVNSAVELALNGLQTTSINQVCPAPSGASLNSQSAVAAYVSCWPTVDTRSLGRVSTPVVNSSEAFNVDGTHAVVAPPGGDEYLVGDTAGNLYRLRFGSTSASWTVALGGTITGPPQAMPDGSTHLVPVANATAGQGCSGSCLAIIDYGSQTPDCYVSTGGNVSSRPVAGGNFRSYAFFGDASGMLYVYDTSGCSSPESSINVSQPVVAGPIVFPGPVIPRQSTADEIYLVTSDSNSSHLVHYEYVETRKGSSTLNLISSQALPAASAVGLAVDQTRQLPANLAITFSGGAVAVAQIQLGPNPPQPASATLPAGIGDAPAWSGTSPNTIGVAQAHGLYVLDANLNQVRSYAMGGTTLSTSPAADGAGDWFVGAANGNLYEAPALTAAPTLIAFGSGQLGQIQSSVQVGQCGGWICAYLASSNTNAYNVQLDARDAVMSACITSASPACSGANPRLWASVEVGTSSSPLTVHVQGWSYYSP